MILLTFVIAGCPGDDKTTTSDATTSAGTSTSSVTSGSTSTGTTDVPTGGTTEVATTDGTTGGLPDGACRTSADCSDGPQSCDPAGSEQCGGATGCNLEGVECTDDSTCAGTPETPQICTRDTCCGLGFCQPGCTGDADCGIAEVCGPDAHCVVSKCSPMAPCPTDFSCTMSTCGPTACDSDAQCEGFCVLGQCSAQLGVCHVLAP